jgi:hypothetical protein
LIRPAPRESNALAAAAVFAGLTSVIKKHLRGTRQTSKLTYRVHVSHNTWRDGCGFRRTNVEVSPKQRANLKITNALPPTIIELRQGDHCQQNLP